MFERNEINGLDKTYLEEKILKMLKQLRLTCKYTKSTNKVIAIVKILTSVLKAKLSQETKSLIWEQIINLLFHEFPVIQKSAADAFYMYLLAFGDDEFGEDQNEEL